MGYITFSGGIIVRADFVSKLFRAYGLYNLIAPTTEPSPIPAFQSSFELMGYITLMSNAEIEWKGCFKALSSLWVI